MTAIEQNKKSDQYRLAKPYPPVQVEQKNLVYAKAMLDNVGGRISEMSAVSLYFYNHLQSKELPEVARAFETISIVEMHHLEIFASLAKELGEDPRLWTVQGENYVYWSPGYQQYPVSLPELLQNALQGEEQAIRKYQQQLEWIEDDGVRANLQRILEDEALHVRIFQGFLEQYGCRK